MRTLVALLGLACVAFAHHLPADTPEVAAAKAAHFAAHAAARGHVWAHPWAYAGAWGHAQIAPDGTPLDTPEVAHAKAAHFAAHAAARTGVAVVGPVVHAGHWNDDGQWHGEGLVESQAWTGYGHGAKWVGPIALPPGYDANGAPLPVQDTPEVAAAKANHLAILNGAHAGASHDWTNGQWNAALWGDHSHHNRWRRSAVLLTRTPGSTVPLVHHAVAVAPHVTYASPLVRTWGYSSVAPIHHYW